MNEHQSVTIILVEDDSGHALLIEKNLRRAGIVNEIVTFTDGGTAVDHLLSRGGNGSSGPVLVLLDLNLPVLDGYQVLERIKSDAKTRGIPVVILTTTDTPREVERCYELGCNVYITKPVDYDSFAGAMQKLGMFLSIVKIPERSGPHG